MESNINTEYKPAIRLKNSEGKQIFFTRVANNEREAVIEAYIQGVDLSDLDAGVKLSDLDEEITKIIADNIVVLFHNLRNRRNKNESRN